LDMTSGIEALRLKSWAEGLLPLPSPALVALVQSAGRCAQMEEELHEKLLIAAQLRHA